VNFSRYEWLFTTAKGDPVGGVDVGQSHYQVVMGKYWEAVKHYHWECDMRDVRLNSCSNFILDLACYLDVPPQRLGHEVLKAQLTMALTQLEKGPTGMELEQIEQMEAWNRKLEQTLASLGEVLQEHTRRWATARSMLTKLEELASPSLYVAGKADLEGPKTPDAQLVLHLIQHLLEELSLKLTNVINAVMQVRNMFRIVVPAVVGKSKQALNLDLSKNPYMKFSITGLQVNLGPSLDRSCQATQFSCKAQLLTPNE
jgi:hypothetical protein